MKTITIASCLIAFCALCCSAQVSPNGHIRVRPANDGIVVEHKTKGMWGSLMHIHTGANSITGSSSKKTPVAYTMLLGKRRECSNSYRETIYGRPGCDSSLTIRAYDDGVAIKACHPRTLDIEMTSVRNNWIARWSDSYEEFFPLNRTDKPDTRLAYPALFEYEDGTFALLSESDMHRDEAATSMYSTGMPMRYTLRPDGTEEGGWQTLIIGSLSDIVESTLITDNSAPCKQTDTSWIEPGVASWVYWAYNHGSNDCDIINRYTDMAAELHLPYVLIDAEWDEMKDGKTVTDAVDYAIKRGVKPMIWYNSSVGWIDGAPGPKFRLNDPEKREQEFAWCESIGVRGVKIDFFSGDTNPNIAYMIDLLECAARHHLLVNFHGATIPRGWQRTYPNLVSTEAVYGAEWYNNKPTMTHKAAAHNATLPFTRNVIGSMDYTPCAFTDSQHPHITTHAHELALTALFESGIQHLADRPESFLSQPQTVRDFLSGLPTAWDETLLLDGYPADRVVLARRHGGTWYIAGINGTDEPKAINFSTKRMKHHGKAVTVITDADGDNSNWNIYTTTSIPTQMECRPRGGFLIIVQ